jgi:hypothetical protein
MLWIRLGPNRAVPRRRQRLEDRVRMLGLIGVLHAGQEELHRSAAARRPSITVALTIDV